jgi:hypothetical protein
MFNRPLPRQAGQKVLGDDWGEADGDGVADLLGDLDLRAAPEEGLGELLKQCRLQVGDHSVHSPRGVVGLPLGWRYWPFSGLKNSVRMVSNGWYQRMRTIVGGACLLLPPASGQQLVGKVEPTPTGWDAVISQQGLLTRIAPEMQIEPGWQCS